MKDFLATDAWVRDAHPKRRITIAQGGPEVSFSADAIIYMFNRVSGDTPAICEAASGKTVEYWKNWQLGKGFTAGLAAGAIPVAGYLTIPADVAYTVRLMHRSVTGICHIELGEANDEVFASVLGVWSGEVGLDDEDFQRQIAAKIAAKSAALVSGPLAIKFATIAFTDIAAVLLSKKLSPKVAVKLATKLTALVAPKGVTRWIPIASALASGVVNTWIINSISKSAENYCAFIKKAAADSAKLVSTELAPPLRQLDARHQPAP